jgi:hypothetical protein
MRKVEPKSTIEKGVTVCKEEFALSFGHRRGAILDLSVAETPLT